MMTETANIGIQSIFTFPVLAGAEVDPADARTWWMTQSYELDKHTVPTSAQMHDHAMTLAGVPAKKFYYDPDIFVQTMAAVAAYYHHDSVLPVADVYNYEAEAMGAAMIYGEDSMPTLDHRRPLVERPADIDKLTAPSDWLSAGRVHYALEACRLSTKMGVNSGLFCAPFSLAVGVRSYAKLIRDMRRDKPFAHELFSRIVDDVLPSYLKTMKDHTGLGVAVGADAWSAYPDLSPDLMDEWVPQYAGRLAANCQKFGLVASNAGGADYCEEDMARFDKGILHRCFDVQSALVGGAPFFFLAMGRTQDYPLEAIVEYLDAWRQKGVTPVVTIGLNARLLRDGPVERIVDCVKRFVDAFARDTNFCIMFGNIPADTQADHVHAAVTAIHTYGHQPIADNLDEVRLQMPKRESFAEYVEKMSGGAGLGI